MKLQDAYAAESNKLGTWELIGYQAPGDKKNANEYNSNVFTYTGSMATAVDLAATGAAAQNDAWKASNVTALNDCAVNSAWSMAVTGATTGITYTKTIGANCEPLTPNFMNIGGKNPS